MPSESPPEHRRHVTLILGMHTVGMIVDWSRTSRTPRHRLTSRVDQARLAASIAAGVRLSSDLAVLGFDHPRLLFQRVDDLVQKVTGAWVDGVEIGLRDATRSP
jgi:hypothetical protein